MALKSYVLCSKNVTLRHCPHQAELFIRFQRIRWEIYSHKVLVGYILLRVCLKCTQFFPLHFMQCVLFYSFNSSRHNAAYMPRRTGPALVQVLAWRRTGDKPLPEPMLIYLSIGPLGAHFCDILNEILALSFKKMHLQMSSARWLPFVRGGGGGAGNRTIQIVMNSSNNHDYWNNSRNSITTLTSTTATNSNNNDMDLISNIKSEISNIW